MADLRWAVEQRLESRLFWESHIDCGDLMNAVGVSVIGPHPEPSKTQQNVIALDYGMRSGRAKIPVRKALLYYALKRLGLDTDPAARRPQDQQIVLLNANQFAGVPDFPTRSSD